MKTYNVSNYQNWDTLAAELTADINEALPSRVSASHTKYGECVFYNLSVSINECSFNMLADFEFADQTRKLALNILLTRGLLHIQNSEIAEILNQYITNLTALQAEIHTVSHDRFVAEREAAREAAEQAKVEAKRKAAQEKAIRDFEALARQDRGICASGEFYYNLGWLAKNIGTISVALPDYLLKYFENHFGTEAKPTVVDSKKRTVSGYPMQWALSMKASLHKKSLDTIPPFAKQYLNSAGTAIADTEFIWDIVENYGFKFGKTQDLEKIRESIPVHCLEYFEKGYAE